VNLELAKMFIDQLSMIQEKTRGNLTTEETTVLRNALSNLQMAFVEVSQAMRGGGAESTPSPEPATEESTPAAESSAEPKVEAPSESESRKKFTKSYGA
jgi:hypothetical protein